MMRTVRIQNLLLNYQRHNMRNIIIVLALFVFSSCTIVRVINVKKFSKELAKSTKNTKSFKTKLQADIKEKKKLLNEVKNYLNNVDNRDLISKLKELIILEKQSVKISDRLIKNAANLPHQNRRKIKKGSKEYKEVMSYKIKIEKDMKFLKKKSDAINKVSKEVEQVLIKKKIYRINPKELSIKIKQEKAKTGHQISKIEQQIKINEVHIGKRPKLKAKFDNIKVTFGRIKQLRNELYNYLEKLNESIVKNKHYWVAPGIVGHDYAKQVGSIVAKIKEQAAIYNKQVEQLK
jgi:hypothetical protein